MPDERREKMVAIGNVVAAATTYGIPAITAILETITTNSDPSVEDIEALAEMMKPPENYFKKPAEDSSG